MGGGDIIRSHPLFARYILVPFDIALKAGYAWKLMQYDGNRFVLLVRQTSSRLATSSRAREAGTSPGNKFPRLLATTTSP